LPKAFAGIGQIALVSWNSGSITDLANYASQSLPYEFFWQVKKTDRNARFCGSNDAGRED
jgi:hypothetical protein